MNGRACNRDFTVLPNNSKIIRKHALPIKSDLGGHRNRKFSSARLRADLHLTRFKYSPVFGATIFANISQAPIL